MAIDADLTNDAGHRRDPVPALVAWLLFLFGQLFGPAYLLWAAAWEAWAASYDGVTGAGRSSAGAAAAVATGAWVLQAVLTAYRRRRGAAAVGGFVCLGLGALVALVCAYTWATM